MINWNLAVRKASLCKQGEGDHRKVVEGIVTRRKRDRTASFNPYSRKWIPRALNYNLLSIANCMCAVQYLKKSKRTAAKFGILQQFFWFLSCSTLIVP